MNTITFFQSCEATFPKYELVHRYFKSHSLLVEQRLEKDKLPEVVRESDVALRYLKRREHVKPTCAVFTEGERRIDCD